MHIKTACFFVDNQAYSLVCFLYKQNQYLGEKMDKMIRVSPETYAQIKNIQTMSQSISQQDIVKQAINRLNKELILQQTDTAFKKLKANKEAWQEELREREEWNFSNNELNDE